MTNRFDLNLYLIGQDERHGHGGQEALEGRGTEASHGQEAEANRDPGPGREVHVSEVGVRNLHSGRRVFQ